jgi:predicted RNA binding protein YcfA (HicA-like mRNA interferase family)
VKRRDLVRHLETNGCQLLREGGSHSVFWIPDTRKASTLPNSSKRDTENVPLSEDVEVYFKREVLP